ncbi:protein LTO1 homolog [Neocloeon triangulifer]|uniref:protein LTO1 homolog n=1 Tax=Neocloeon triangulifer TaxID=2078957 RepID=UPI00286F83DE|nr:protein LTO1 homolog [Neocloeon triangulifer]
MADEEEKDVNELFDSIVMLEQKVASDGFREGFEKGQQEGTEDGYRVGHQHGMKLGTELGFYRGAARAWIESSQGASESKGVGAMKTVIELLDKFPTMITKDVDVNEEMNKVRAAYRKACSLLKIDAVSPTTTTLSF